MNVVARVLLAATLAASTSAASGQNKAIPRASVTGDFQVALESEAAGGMTRAQVADFLSQYRLNPVELAGGDLQVELAGRPSLGVEFVFAKDRDNLDAVAYVVAGSRPVSTYPAWFAEVSRRFGPPLPFQAYRRLDESGDHFCSRDHRELIVVTIQSVVYRFDARGWDVCGADDAAAAPVLANTRPAAPQAAVTSNPGVAAPVAKAPPAATTAPSTTAVDLPPDQAAKYEKIARETILGDSDNWMFNEIDRDSIGGFLFSTASNGAIVLRATYRFEHAGGIVDHGWVDLHFSGDKVFCMTYVDNQRGCYPPRMSAEQHHARLVQQLAEAHRTLASLGNKGPLPVPPATCFDRRTEIIEGKPIMRLGRVGPGEFSTPALIQDGQEPSRQSDYEVYVCRAPIHAAYECLDPDGSMRETNLNLVPGERSSFGLGTRDRILDFNKSIAEKNCARTN